MQGMVAVGVGSTGNGWYTATRKALYGSDIAERSHIREKASAAPEAADAMNPCVPDRKNIRAVHCIHAAGQRGDQSIRLSRRPSRKARIFSAMVCRQRVRASKEPHAMWGVKHTRG